MANPSDVPKIYRDGSFWLFDSGGYTGSNRLELPYTDGDVSLTFEPNARIVGRNRGVISAVRSGDQPVLSVSLSIRLRQFTNSGQVVPLDAMRGTGYAGSNWTKYHSWIEQWNTGARFRVQGTTHGDAADHYVDVFGIVWVPGFAEKTNDFTMISITGEIYGSTVTVSGA